MNQWEKRQPDIAIFTHLDFGHVLSEIPMSQVHKLF